MCSGLSGKASFIFVLTTGFMASSKYRKPRGRRTATKYSELVSSCTEPVGTTSAMVRTGCSTFFLIFSTANMSRFDSFAPAVVLFVRFRSFRRPPLMKRGSPVLYGDG